MSGELEQVTKPALLTERLPFLSAIATFLFSGGMFLSLTAPLAFQLLRGEPALELKQLLGTVYAPWWEAAAKTESGLLPIAAFLFFSLVSGLVLVPLARVLTHFTVVVLRMIDRKLAPIWRRAPINLFTSAAFALPDNAAFMSWLMSNPTAKAHWEWEFFLYQLYWDLFMNAGLFFACLALVLRQNHSLLWFVVPAAALMLLILLYAAARSMGLAATHVHYRGQFAARERARGSDEA